jgi:hypothetical protein
MNAVRKRLTYANIVASVALFLALGGGAVWAAGKIGTNKLKRNAVTAAKIKRNAVTGAKIRAGAVTGPKIKAGAVAGPKIEAGAVGFAKLAAGANVIAKASSIPVPASIAGPTTVNLVGTTSFTPSPTAVNFLSIEARGESLGRAGEEPCEVRVVPFVNGSEWGVAEGALTVSAFTPTPERPTGQIPITGGTAPIGLTNPGVTQTVSAQVFGDADCAGVSAVSVAIVVTQAK